MKKVFELKPATYNPRKISPERLTALAKSMAAFGDLSGIVFNRRSGNLVGGHQRVKQLDPSWRVSSSPSKDKVGTVALGYVETPQGRWSYREVDWDARREKAANVAANAAGGDFDRPLLKAVVLDLQKFGYDLDLLNLADLDMLKGDLGGGKDADAVPAVPKVVVTKVGDVWTLGAHRLVCGDCADPKSMQKLYAGEKAALAVTSPPYASQRKYDPSSGFKPIPPDQYVQWFKGVADAIQANLAGSGSFFLNIKEHCDEGERHLYVKDLVIEMARGWGWKFVDEFVWTHGGTPKAVVNRFKNGWEPIFHFTRAPKHAFYPKAVRHETGSVPDFGGKHPSLEALQGGVAKRARMTGDANNQGTPEYGKAIRDQVAEKADGLAYPSNVLSLGKNREALGHSAAYPVSLPEFFIKAYTQPGEIVHDPFGGSGTTMIAAERLGRRGFLSELSPAYCDLIVKRWEDFTGKRATRAK